MGLILKAIGSTDGKGLSKSALLGWCIRELKLSGQSSRDYLKDAMLAAYLEERDGSLFLTPDGKDFIADARA